MEIKNSIICSIITDDLKTFLNEIEKIKTPLEEFKVDLSKNSLIHIIADNNRFNFLESLLDLYRKKNKEKNDKEIKIEKWLKSENEKGLTALFYAVYNGNLVI